MTIKLDVVSVERMVFSGDVDVIIAPGKEGQLGILPKHAALMTTLNAGELVARHGNEEFILAISGGFLEVQPDHVIVLADAAERAEEIDISRAEAARKRAQEKIAHPASRTEALLAEAALRRAVARIEVAERRRRRLRS
jgi:F-type H+-transporting ATPase subunit epsilon